MKPQKASSLYKDVSEENNISETLVSDIVEFYYKELKGVLVNLSVPRVNVEGLGHLVIKTKVAAKTIERLERVVDTHDVSTFKAYYNKKGIEEKLELLKSVSLKIQEEETRKVEFYKTKKNESSIKSNLGK
jgi:hypothetical protein